MTSVVEARPVSGRRAVRKRGSFRGWLAARGLFALSAVLRRLPDGPLHRLADGAGGILYRVQPARRRLVRGNLERVVTYLAERQMGGPRVAAAARDGRALDALVRSAFGHYVRGYLESATLRRYATDAAIARIRPDDKGAAEAAFPDGRGGPLIIVGLHFGAVEIPALWATRSGVRITAPMETVADPNLQSYFERTRGDTGLTVIPLDGAAARLRAALVRGETIALVADRAVTGGGARLKLFGASARLPAGPAVLSLENGVPAWVIATRRAGAGEYRTHFERIDVPQTGTAREQLAAFMTAEARAFERAVADAPEQWWTIFFPIWDDITGAPA